MTALPTFKIYPETITLDINECLLVMSRPVSEEDLNVSLQIMGEQAIRVEITAWESWAFLVTIPEEHLQTEIIMVYIQYKDKMIGCHRLRVEKPGEQLARLLEKALDPVQMMISALGLKMGSDADMRTLDHDLANVVSKNIPASNLVMLFKDYNLATPTSGNLPTYNRFPTALHFSAHYGFTRLTETLLYCHGSKAALMVVNSDGHTPRDIANNTGNQQIIRAFEKKATEHEEDYESLAEIFGQELHPVPEDSHSPYMDMTQVTRPDGQRWSVLGQTTSGPRLPNRPPPPRTRANSVGQLQIIQEADTAELRDSGVFDGNRDSNISAGSRASSDSLPPCQIVDSPDGPDKGSKLKRTPPVTTIRRGDSLCDASDGSEPFLGHRRTKRPSLPNIHMPYTPQGDAPPPCTGAIYQNQLPKVPPPVGRRKMSLPGGMDMAAELQNNEIFQKRKLSVPS